MDADGGHWHVGVQMHCVWTRISVKKKEKRTYLCVEDEPLPACRGVDMFVLGCALCVHVDMDRCKEKTKRNEKTYLEPGRVDADMQMCCVCMRMQMSIKKGQKKHSLKGKGMGMGCMLTQMVITADGGGGCR